MVDTIACYILDEGYLLPALVSAIQARKYSSKELMDVVVYCVGKQTEGGKAAIEVAKANGVELIYIPGSFSGGKPMTYGRLYIQNVMPEHYKRIIYIDGDTQVAGSLDPLATAPLARGKFMAVRDPGVMYATISKKWRDQLSADRKAVDYKSAFDDYFNAGILVINRDGWDELAAKAMADYDKLLPKLIHYDQDLMNLTVSEACVRISNRWNFPGFLIGTPMEKRVKPVIYHFMSNPRPWNNAVAPWGYKWMKPYDDFLKQYPQMAFLKPRRPLGKHLKFIAQQAYKTITEYNPVGKLKELKPDIEL
jgi:lipopolysaccharide biosynthesis glycosyltransferase